MNKKLIKGCNIIDVVNGNILNKYNIVINNDKIEEIASEVTGSDFESVLDCDNLWIIPGLMDLHVHLTGESNPSSHKTGNPRDVFKNDDISALLLASQNLMTSLQAGVTLVRDTGSPRELSLKLKRIQEAGNLNSPRIHACGQLITGVGGWGKEIGRQVNGHEEMKIAIKEEISNGADFIKIINDPIQFNDEDMKMAVEFAHSLGKKVACHAYSEDAIAIAIESGADTIEHGSPFSRKMAQSMMSKGIVLVPTYTCAIQSVDPEKSLESKELTQLMIEYRNTLTRNLPMAIKEGVILATGTDAGFPPIKFDSVIDEIIEFSNLGYTPLESLKSATIVSAIAIGRELELGSIEQGKLADLTILYDNPLDDLHNLEHVAAVMVGGRLLVNKL